SEEHNSWFKETFVCDECGLPLVSFFDSNIVIARPDVHLCKDRGSFQLVYEVRNEGKGICILHCILV
ncbi:hypothetical protein M404DRAFT_172251, partial [Pisolithus tinctorius Marx 270]